MTLFERIKYLTGKRGMSISEVERKAGLGENYIYTLKKSENPRRKTIEAIAKVLGVTPDYLFRAEENDAPIKTVDIEDDDVIMTFEGKVIPPEDIEIMERLLRGKRDK